MIQFKNVSKSYIQNKKENQVLNQISFSVEPGEIFGVVGPSGAGKSTLLNLVNGLATPSAGEVVVCGSSLAHLSGSELLSLKKNIGMIFQHFNLLGNRDVYKNVSLPLNLSGSVQESVVIDALRFVNMQDKTHQYPIQLSGGEKQRVGIARALITNPKILLCDEPTSALDDQHKEDIAKLLLEANRVFGTTIVIVSHELEFIKGICNRVAVLEEGNLLNIFTMKNTIDFKEYDSYYDRVKASLC